MSDLKKLPFDAALIAETFGLVRSGKCGELDKWLGQRFSLDEVERVILAKTHAEMVESSGYLNEEELKIRFIAPLFQVANIDDGNRIRVFYERPLSAKIDGHQISVICDCMVAASSIFKTPTEPYFFLQEFKKAKGEKRDPEAQMLAAMLAAQKMNGDQKPVYGGFLIGSRWELATLVGREYCSSQPFYADREEDLLRLAFAIRGLKGLILNR